MPAHAWMHRHARVLQLVQQTLRLRCDLLCCSHCRIGDAKREACLLDRESALAAAAATVLPTVRDRERRYGVPVIGFKEPWLEKVEAHASLNLLEPSRAFSSLLEPVIGFKEPWLEKAREGRSPCPYEAVIMHMNTGRSQGGGHHAYACRRGLGELTFELMHVYGYVCV